ncbi:plasmid stabilization system protein ParE [Breznakibacter xylanolyticus]|uniref:Plasmid stabilization system protein ParE n=1 Tax=Breznakibacter xylanolyticus TaxID=990 RepID=A0A2W7MWJ4_9BACT|nr:plasmid stabilization system protein ParE [Breznakibacter xylanolyticus]
MAIRIEWSQQSEKQLKEIFDYYSVVASKIIARKIVNGILERVSILESNPFAGPKEVLLNNYPEEFRYLVESNFKIIYWENENLITIASIFDCRQNPDKIKKL